MADTAVRKKTNRAERRGKNTPEASEQEGKRGRKNASGGGRRKGGGTGGRRGRAAGTEADITPHGPEPDGTPKPDPAPVRRPRQYSPRTRRRVLGVVMGILALCAFFGAFGSDAILLNWLSSRLKGLFGYGCWLSVPVFAFCSYVLLRYADKPARGRILPALALMPVLGVLGHILLCGLTFPTDGLLTRLWTTGKETLSGGLISGAAAHIFTGLFSWQVSLILFSVLFLWLLTAALRWNIPAIIDLIRRRLISGEDWEDDDSGGGGEDGWSHPRVTVIRSEEDTQRVSVRQPFALDGEEGWYDASGMPDMDGGGAGWPVGPDTGAGWPVGPDATDGRPVGAEAVSPSAWDDGDRIPLDDRDGPLPLRGGGEGTQSTRRSDDGARRSSQRKPQKRGLFSALRDAVQGEAARLFSRRGGETGPADEKHKEYGGGAYNSREYGSEEYDSREYSGGEYGNAVLDGGSRDAAFPVRDGDDERDVRRSPGRRTSGGTGRPVRARDGGERNSGERGERNGRERGERRGGENGQEARPRGKPSGSVGNGGPGRAGGGAAANGAGSANGTNGAGGAGGVPDAETDPRKARAAASREVAAQQAAVSQEIAKNMVKPERKYRYPSLSNLYENKARNYVEAGAELRGNSRRLADTLNSFGVEATPGDVIHGPAVTRYEYTLEQGVKLSKITNLADDIALALGATGVRIAPIPTKSSVVGIEVPNRQVTPVLIRDVVASQDFRNHPSTTAFALGKDIGGKNIVGCIEQLPHVLIAGTTGSGKSVCTNSLIISMLFHARPDQVRFIMVDPKMVELAPYNGIPHLLIPVVTDPKKAAGALQWATVEMMKRYRTFSEYGVKKLAEYNKAADARALEPMPSIVVVIDELADLMMAAAKEVEESIVRIAQMGRAAGMHLVIATQRPSADVITGLMKANIPSRIAFAVASSMESRIILDTPGAEKLVGKGDMLYAPLGESRIRVQGCYIAPEEIERVVAFVKQTSEASYDNDVIAKIEAAAQERKPPEQMTIPETPQEADELLPAAVEVVLETGQASVSMLQRRLKLGYSRAARLVDQMEEKGYVGPFEGSRPRQLILTQEKWQEMKLAHAQ